MVPLQQEAPSYHFRGDSDTLLKVTQETLDHPTEARPEEDSHQETIQEVHLPMEEARRAAIRGVPHQVAAGPRGATAHPAIASLASPSGIQEADHRTEAHLEVRGDTLTWMKGVVC